MRKAKQRLFNRCLVQKNIETNDTRKKRKRERKKTLRIAVSLQVEDNGVLEEYGAIEKKMSK